MRGRLCLAHEHSAPAPIVFHSLRPLPRGGRGTRTVQLCVNGSAEVYQLLDLIEDRAMTSPFSTSVEVVRNLPRDVWAAYGGPERVIAYRAWAGDRRRDVTGYGTAFLNGRYAIHYRHWRTDGSPKQAGVPMFSDIGHAARWSRRWRRELESL
jgi:hypothetical protein